MRQQLFPRPPILERRLPLPLATAARLWWISWSLGHSVTTVMMSPLVKVSYLHLHRPRRHIEDYRQIVIVKACSRETHWSDVSDLIEARLSCRAAAMKGHLTWWE
jgi:hypothetical protein